MFNRLENSIYGPICANEWTEEWSDEVCAGMNYLGGKVSFNSTLQASQFFVLNATLRPDDVSHVQEARSYEGNEECSEAINFQCRDFGMYPFRASYIMCWIFQ